MKPIHELTIAEAGSALRSGAVTSVELTEAALDRVAALDPALHYFYLLTTERARSDAARADKELRAGHDRGPLHGIPYGLKDILDTAGIQTTCNSKLLLGHLPDEDSAVEAKLRAGGGVLLGKLATSEFACGGPGDDLPYPISRNPWHLDHYTGGSSAGSAGGVSVGFMRAAIGTDTGGSTRVPAHYCGVVGLKPTYGLISTRGVFPLAPSFDHCAPLTRSVRDMALLMNVIAGYDPRDPASVDHQREDYTRKLGQGVRGLRIAYAREYLVTASIFPDLLASLDRAVEIFRNLGAVVEEVALPDFELFRACSRVVVAAEAFAIHEETLRSRPRDYGIQTYQRLVAGTAISAADLVHAYGLRRDLVLAIRNVLGRYDAAVTATGLGEPPLIATPSQPSRMIGSPTVICSLTGNPAVSVPIGLSSKGLPFGMQIFARHFDEARLLQVAAALEEAVGFTDSAAGMPPIGRNVAATRKYIDA